MGDVSPDILVDHLQSSAETRDQREPGAGRSLEEIRRLRRLSGGHGRIVLGGEIYALRASPVRDGVNGCCGMTRAAPPLTMTAGTHWGHGITVGKTSPDRSKYLP